MATLVNRIFCHFGSSHTRSDPQPDPQPDPQRVNLPLAISIMMMLMASSCSTGEDTSTSVNPPPFFRTLSVSSSSLVQDQSFQISMDVVIPAGLPANNAFQVLWSGSILQPFSADEVGCLGGSSSCVATFSLVPPDDLGPGTYGLSVAVLDQFGQRTEQFLQTVTLGAAI